MKDHARGLDPLRNDDDFIAVDVATLPARTYMGGTYNVQHFLVPSEPRQSMTQLILRDGQGKKRLIGPCRTESGEPTIQFLDAEG